MDENLGSEPEPDLSSQEREIVRLLGNLEDPAIPVAVSERISHAIAAEVGAREALAAANTTGDDEPSLANTTGADQGGTVHELAPRRRTSTKLFGALAGVAAVAIIGVIGVNVLNGDNSNDIVAGDNPTPSAGSAESRALSATPVVVTGTTYKNRTLHDQVQSQLQQWKAVSQRVQASPELLADIDLDGLADPTSEPGARQVAESVQELRQRLPECLAGVDQAGAKPLVVDMAKFQESPADNAQRVAVVAIPKFQDESQNPATYNGPYDVYVLGVDCGRAEPHLMAFTTVDPDNN